MELTLHTETTIDSAHKLVGYEGKCANIHGHTWHFDIWFRGDSQYKDKVGILVDFGLVKKLKDRIDHKYLNDIFTFNTTAENLTEWTYNFFKKQINSNIGVKVRLYETKVGKDTYCEGGDW